MNGMVSKTHGCTINSPCKIGDKIKTKSGDYIFTVESIELHKNSKSGLLFRCGKEGAEDYYAFRQRPHG